MDELNKYSNLSKISKRDGFEVPEDYFENLPYQIQQRLVNQNDSSLFFQYLKRPVFKFALSFFILFLVFFLVKKNPEREVVPMSSNELMSYVDQEGIADFDQEMLADELLKTDFAQEKKNDAYTDPVYMEEYLLIQGVSEADLIAEVES